MERLNLMETSSFRLKNLVIKPILKCNANCAFCEQRLDHYKKSNNQSSLSFENWMQILYQAAALKVNCVSISGGEPTLYKNLLSLIEICKSNSLKVHLKTNAFLIDKEYAHRLSSSGLDLCTISIYSQDSDIHDRIKGLRGSHNSAVQAIEYLKNEGIKINIQTILTSNIMNNFDEYLDWIGKLRVNNLYISYLEGNYSIGRPTMNEISDFVSNMIPKCKSILSNILEKYSRSLNSSLKNLDGLFKFDGVSYKDIANGFYNKPGFRSCGRNHSMALILANGEVHPCNAVEYFHGPIVGNLMTETLSNAWQSPSWQYVQMYGMDICHYCPMNQHTYVDFVGRDSEYSFYSPP